MTRLACSTRLEEPRHTLLVFHAAAQIETLSRRVDPNNPMLPQAVMKYRPPASAVKKVRHTRKAGRAGRLWSAGCGQGVELDLWHEP